MLNHFFSSISKLGDKYMFLKDNFLWRKIRTYYNYVKFLNFGVNFGVPTEKSISFYTQNTERIKLVANILADEKSKNILLGLIKFRQTHNKKDFPFYPIKEEQYFIKEIKFNKEEVFIDCGAYIGDTIYKFEKRCREYKQIVAFEPDSINFDKLKEKYENNKKITLINACVGDKEGKLTFSSSQGQGSGVVAGDLYGKQNVISIPVKTIDDLNLEMVSFIKMDIEGEELSALRGAEKTILRDKPKLAICIYHSDEDMIRIAEYIYSIVPEYKLYVRHYGYVYETVLYAVIP